MNCEGQQVHQVLHYIVSNKCFCRSIQLSHLDTKTDTQTHTHLHTQYLHVYSLTNINYVVHVYCKIEVKFRTHKCYLKFHLTRHTNIHIICKYAYINAVTDDRLSSLQTHAALITFCLHEDVSVFKHSPCFLYRLCPS